jgi:ribosome maturation factor RimP
MERAGRRASVIKTPMTMSETSRFSRRPRNNAVAFGLIDDSSSKIEGTFERVTHELSSDAALAHVEIVSTSAHRRHSLVELRVVIDKPGGVDVATCERISHKLNSALDAYDEKYTLSVESAGLERPLVRPADYERFIDSNIKLTTSIVVRGAKTHRGRLLGMRGTNVVLAQPEGELPIPLTLIKHANVEYDFRADLRREKRERRHKR